MDGCHSKGKGQISSHIIIMRYSTQQLHPSIMCGGLQHQKYHLCNCFCGMILYRTIVGYMCCVSCIVRSNVQTRSLVEAYTVQWTPSQNTKNQAKQSQNSSLKLKFMTITGLQIEINYYSSSSVWKKLQKKRRTLIRSPFHNFRTYSIDAVQAC